ncbi:hypothetical protein OIE66_25020 [Nonomuraea sp. NBC_01738]|uniref:hypothetical protein n=1 Tax=Nonomuraea sp. NBC_01738 TaxID=2976003 RepID=UPI002E134934|nr:hypothetical protein OIE66_25020 [Nonomuraea sp. NBC_01738]
MSQRLTLLAILGAADLAEAARRWPRSAFLPGLGMSIGGPSDYEPLLSYLDQVLFFHSVRPGSAADRVGLVAEMVIEPHPAPLPLVLRELPDLAFVLRPNAADTPARVFVTQSDTGVEVVVEGLPVEIRLPQGLVTPLRPEEEELLGPALIDVPQGGPFQAGGYDTLAVSLSEMNASSIFVHLRVRLTEELQVVLEPAVPISFGPCRFGGLPCRAVHDLGLLPYPVLSGAHTEHELPLEWARHTIPGGFGMEGTGLITVRTLDLDHDRDPIKRLAERFTRDNAADETRVEFVLEDLALPVAAWVTPVATHGRFGLRRAVLKGGDKGEPYDLDLAPVEVSLAKVVDWRLRIFRLLFESPGTLVARMAVLFGDSPEQDHALVVDVSDGWLLQGAWLPPAPIHLFTVANVKVSLMTAKLGLLLKDLHKAQGAKGWFEHVRALVDLGVEVGDGKDETVQVSLPAKPPSTGPGVDVVLRDLGWDLGEAKILPGLWFPEGVKLTVFEVVQCEIEELAFVNEDNGGRYVALSGGIAIFPGQGAAEREKSAVGLPDQKHPDGGGLRFRRLRLRTGGNELAPRWLLDGISLFIKAGTFELMGSGSITDVTRDGHRYREFGLGLLLRFAAMGKEFSIGAQLFYGRVTGPVDRFTYWLFGLQLGYCPAGSFELRGVSALLAGGMVPDLPAPTGRPQEMRLLEWYRQHRTAGAVSVRSDRGQQRGGWRIEQGAQAAGVGADLGLSMSKAVTLRVFMFVHRSDAGGGLLISAEVFALKAVTPIGFAAIEVDLERDKWGLLAGVDLDLSALLDSDSPLIKDVFRLTGTIYAGNQPGMFAIGQLNDQASWLTASANKSLLGLTARLRVGFCLQITAKPGPRGFGIVASASAEGPMGIGKVRFYAALGLIVGTWGNEASSSGVIAWAEVALRIKVFWVFSFGIQVKAAFEQLGPQEPNYRRVGLEVRIETPWWLPDVTFRVERVRNTPQPEAMPVLSAPLSAATVREPGLTTEGRAAITALAGLHTIDQLRGLSAGPISEAVWNSLTPVSVDSTLALDLSVPVTNDTTVAPATAAGAGRQSAAAPAENHLSTAYTLVRVAVRRRPRFGPGAGVWTDLLAPADSEIAGLEELLADADASVRFASALRFQWDADVVADGAVDPRRLLVNADTPYSFLAAAPGIEEGLLATDPSFPCCSGKRTAPQHVVDFADVPLGTRSQPVRWFTHSTSTLRWQLARPPVVAASSGVHVARADLAGSTDLAVAVAVFDEPAYTVDVNASWKPGERSGALIVEAARGLEIVDRQVHPFNQTAPAIRCRDPRGITSLTLRYSAADDTREPPPQVLEIRSLGYRTVREERDLLAEQARCKARGGLAGGGRLAWLPNHDYELALTVRTSVDYQGTTQEALVEQRAGFRTRGLPGLNAVSRPGEELEPYVESFYPGTLLYRSEPIVLAFDERFNSLLPVDRTPAPGAPAERTQLLEWALAVEQDDGLRLSVTSADWIVTHRGTAPPPRRRTPRVLDATLLTTEVRQAPSLVPHTLRLEALERLSPSCGGPAVRLHSSQVLRHAPVDPDGGGQSLWPSRTSLRVAVRRKNGPFVARSPFEDGDQSALTVADEGRDSATGWRVEEGVLRSNGAPADGVRRYAVLGEGDWDHIRLRAQLDPEGGSAGLAVSVAGLPRVNRALVALVDEAGGRLRILARRGGLTQELASAPLPARGAGPYSLEVLAFDDHLRARVGETTVEVRRGDLRGGRVALVTSGTGWFAGLHVDGLDAFAAAATTSRYPGFTEHVASWDGALRPAPGDAAAVPALLAATLTDVESVMSAGADPQLRQRLFDAWIGELALPLAPVVDGIRLSALGDAGGTSLVLLESPEPLPFSRDVSLIVSGPGDEAVDVAVLTNSVEDRALLIPAAPLAPGTYVLSFALDRSRYRAAAQDATTNYRATATMTVSI